jgi:DNA-binding HxlR family transcriptional regulator
MERKPVQREHQTRRFARLRPLLARGEGAAALRLLANRWSLLILRDAFQGVRRFEDLRRLSGAARGTLTARLALLVEADILRRSPYRDGRLRQEYRLTARGLECYPIALALWRWERRWGRPDAVPPRLLHATCGSETEPRFVCARCHEALHPDDLRFTLGAIPRSASATREQRRRDPPLPRPAAGVDHTLFDALDVVGDRWSALLLAALFLGARRHDELRDALGIASNILADRLRRMQARGIVEACAYQERPLRYEYHLTARGWDLYPFALALQDWAGQWLAPRGVPALRLQHAGCGRRLRVHAVCDDCGERLQPRDVRLRATRRWNSLRHRASPRRRAAAQRARPARTHGQRRRVPP